jgi:hypothetical protein
MAVRSETRPRWPLAARVAAIVAGVLIGLFAALYAVFASLAACEGSPVYRPTDVWFCQEPYRDFVEPVEMTLMSLALLGPIAGGIASARASRGLWLVVGVLIAMASLLGLVYLNDEQVPTLS